MSGTFCADDLTVRPAHPHEVGWMLHEHYLGKWPAVATAIIALCRRDVTRGCIVFAEAPRETSKRYGGHTWELARLWIHDDEPRNTASWFIARAVRLVKRLCPSVRFLVSYADPSVGHVGTVYRAANWRFDGQTDEERKTPRFDYLCDGKHYSRKAHLPPGRPYERVPRVSKARYVLRLKPWGSGRGSRLSPSSVASPLGVRGSRPVYDPFGDAPELTLLDGAEVHRAH